MRLKRVAGFTAVVAAVLGGLAFAKRAERPSRVWEANRPAAIRPDYSGVTIPPNIAPLHFRVAEPGAKFYVRAAGADGTAIEVFSARGEVRFPTARWRALLEASRGRELRFDVYVKTGGRWAHYETVRNRVAKEEIDPYAVYRLIPPVYNKWDHIEIRQRDLRGFEERVVLDNKLSLDREGRNIESACINCHTFLNHGTKQMLLHMRPAQKHQMPAMVLVRDGRAHAVDTRDGGPPAAYIAWHPSGNLLAFSRNRLVQMFHTAGLETREVVDLNSDLGLHDVGSGRTYTAPQISRPDRLETFPAWAPDGRHLYFCSAPSWSDRPNAVLDFDKVRYDLVRVSYDLATREWGEPETLVSAAELGRSASLPSISPDGRFVLFCGHDYGSFPIFQPSSDLYLLDVTRWGSAGARAGVGKRGGNAVRRVDELNSPYSDSYHSWSSNGRWVLFSSKRDDGLFARLYIAYFSPEGLFHKPFVLPQQDPAFYERCLRTFNRAELVREPVLASPSELVRAIRTPTGLRANRHGDPGDTPWQPVR